MRSLFTIISILLPLLAFGESQGLPEGLHGRRGVIVTPLQVVLADQMPEESERVCASLVEWQGERILFIEDVWDCSLARKLARRLGQKTWIDLTPQFYFSDQKLENLLRQSYADASYILIDRE